ncbi:MAG TPA: hypothetical protein VGB73_00130 [Pyrinomonadaceae bacterium]|jgi:hypothetical protein
MNDAELKRNPATRLYEILDSARRQNPGEQTRGIWCKVFDIPDPKSESSLFAVLEHLIALRKLFAEVEAALRHIPNVNENLFIKPITRLAEIVDINGLHNTWAGYSTKIRGEDIIALKYAEDLLSQYPALQENEIPISEIQEILDELDILYESIATSELPQGLRESLLDLIQEMRNGIHEYRVRGASALHDILEKSIGVLAVNKEAIEENNTSEDVQALGRMLVRIDKLYSFALKMKPMLEATANILPRLLGSGS